MYHLHNDICLKYHKLMYFDSLGHLIKKLNDISGHKIKIKKKDIF